MPLNKPTKCNSKTIETQNNSEVNGNKFYLGRQT